MSATTYLPRRPHPTLLAFCLIAAVFLAACRSTPPPASDREQPVTLIVSAASDLTYAFGEIGRQFEAETAGKVTFNFGSTGQLAQQIEQGAPADVFAAANVSFIEDLERQGRIAPGTKRVYARGRIVLWTRADNPLRPESLGDLARPEITRVAIANPDHAPYGVAAREALQTAGVWEAVQPKLVLGENVRQALQYAETGNVDAAIVALSLVVPAAQGSNGGVQGRWTTIPQELHRPLDQALAVVKGTAHEREAAAFADFVAGPRGQEILRKYGFEAIP
ncbi:MAG: molybdate ABC transporter substrate-binding protein [Chloroflexi bacterium]|nr:molybdate ABC transporter substrate-binding protein [Chloroflexota bacterium]